MPKNIGGYSNLPIFQSLIRPLGFLLWLLAASQIWAQVNLPPAADVRILIDISGSMKKNDPNNLRRPALNLVTELLPKGDTAGVWTFGQYVNELVRHQQVDDNWRRLARQKAKEINSVALFTNIGAALEKASEDLVSGQDYSHTHFILLTDGVVDVSQTPGDNVSERERIQTQLLPKFKARKAKIHTIALSKNADQTLLKNLSVQTDGIAAIAETSEDLSRVFLQALERASPAEEIPLEDNAFDVDSSVEEFTALIFRADPSAETVIVEPTGKKFSAKDHADYVRWFNQGDYDLITVQRPLEGEWKLESELAPGSKVTVVSNLRLVVDPLPSNFYAGDQLEIRAAFFEDGEQVLNSSFLSLVQMDVTISTEDNKSGTKTISDPNAPPVDGVFKEKITRLKKVGRYFVSVQADGRTFKRQVRQMITLNAPMAAELEATGTGADTRYRVIIRPLSPNIDVEKTAIVSKIKAPDGGNIIKAVPYNAETQRWELDVEPSKGDGLYVVSLRVDGVTQTENKFRFEPDAIEAEFPRQEASPNEFRSIIDDKQTDQMNDVLAEEPNRAEAKPEPPVTEKPEEAIEETPEEATETEEEASGLDPVLLVALIGGGAALVVCVGLGVWLLKRKKAENDLIKERTSKKGKPDKPEKDLKATKEDELDLEDEIEQLENPEVTDDLEIPDDMEDPDDMEFKLEEPEPSDDLDIPDIPDTPPEPEPEPEPEVVEDDDEFNLEDFDISDTDDLPSPDNEVKP